MLLCGAVPPPGPSFRAEAPAKGKLLIASRQLNGPLFAETVVLLLEYGPEGAMGLIVNRPTSVPLATLVPDWEALRDRPETVYLGGPVASHTLYLLIRAAEPPPESTRIVGDVYGTASGDTLRSELERDPSADRVRAYVGYAGWAPRQLDAELARGDWHLADGSPKLVFEVAASELWPELVRQHEGVQVRRPGWPATDVQRASGAIPDSRNVQATVARGRGAG